MQIPGGLATFTIGDAYRYFVGQTAIDIKKYVTNINAFVNFHLKVWCGVLL